MLSPLDSGSHGRCQSGVDCRCESAFESGEHVALISEPGEARSAIHCYAAHHMQWCRTRLAHSDRSGARARTIAFDAE
jgi:hypothetical protein